MTVGHYHSYVPARKTLGARLDIRKLAHYLLDKKNIWIVLIWGGVNTSSWRWLSFPDTPVEWIHWLRTGFPLLALLAGLPVIFSKHPVLAGPLKYWILYGAVGIFASIFSQHPLHALYWGVNYIAVFAGVGLYLKKPSLSASIDLNYLSWGITLTILIAMVFVAREALQASSVEDVLVYNIYARIGDVGGMPISRSSGMARFAAVPAVVGFVMLWAEQRIQYRAFGGGIFVISALIVWSLQSRGAILGLAFAMCFVTFFLGRRSRFIGIFGAIFCAFMLWTDFGSEQWIDYIYNHVSRGEAMGELATMSGRDRAWREAWPEILEHPLFGQGFQADRFTINDHVHNTYMYALMTTGFFGAGLFILGLAWAWLLFWRAWQNNWGRKTGHHLHLIQVGGVLAFFTVRSIPEVSGAMYSIDQFLMVPAIAYLTILSKTAGRRR